jgi:hypothetical protein
MFGSILRYSPAASIGLPGPETPTPELDHNPPGLLSFLDNSFIAKNGVFICVGRQTLIDKSRLLDVARGYLT